MTAPSVSAATPSPGRLARREALRAAGAVAVVRLASPAQLDLAVDAVVAGGIRAIEITLTTPGAIEALASLAARLPADVMLGAGSVFTTAQADAALAAGATFVVSPIVQPALVATVHAHDALAILGGVTPTELWTAWQAGADVVKLFPADTLGPKYVAAVRGPMPALPLLPTGGVTPTNAGEWIRAGAMAVGLGGALVDPALVAAGDRSTLEARARATCASIAAVREGAVTA